jgi:4'-phosphopantetheinyl transferase
MTTVDHRASSPGAVDVVCVATDHASPAAVAALTGRLTPDERARHGRFVRAVDRDAFAITRALVRASLSAHGALAPSEWRFGANAHGCPSVVEAQAGSPPLQYNLSHTSGLAVVAVTRGPRVGVDVEAVDRTLRHDIAAHHFAPSEVAALRALPEDEQGHAFFEYWTLKEAYIKARGLGLAIPLGEFAFTLRPPAPPRVQFADGFDDDAARWQFWQAWATPRHRVGLAIERTGPDLTATLRTIPVEALLA